ncbi:TauD/TfdA family dioxygenase [Pseudohalocynthiibacter sp. F2068]|nr:TauD/TfdA family dioxygenase [Pseudohalocynthiibacter sp. F2068]MCK0102482.1 TauD/TfdA family dioxygenase [Pseudohalocynthiibacter sp. F2068]
MTFEINQLTRHIGVEISGIDFSKPLSDKVQDQIYDTLMAHQVLFFRDQDLSPESQLEFAKSFGEPEPPHPICPHVEGHPQVMLLDFSIDNPPDTDAWHTDATFKAEPPFASILYSRVIPPVGGDTLWSSMTAAYDALPNGMKQDLAELRAVHNMSDFRNNFTVNEPDGDTNRLTAAHQRFGSAIHPIVRNHPTTGRPFLFADPGVTVHVVGMTSVASRRLLYYLFDHMDQPEFQVHFKWNENAIAIWDNRRTMHYAISDYLPHR